MYYEFISSLSEILPVDCDFFHAADSFMKQLPSRECIETREPSVLIYISRTDLYQLYANHPQACCIGRIIAERLLFTHQDIDKPATG